MGLPVLTRLGRAFASRMAGSLVRCLGLPDLITHNQAEYEARAIEIGRDLALCAELKRRLQHGKEHSPVFDMPGFVNDFSDAVERVALRG